MDKKRCHKSCTWGTLTRWFVSVALSFALLPSTFTLSLAETPPLDDPTTFDHIATGFPLEGEHNNITCESCHIGGIFEALPTRCEACHDGVFARGQPPGHIPTQGTPCETCHNESGFLVATAATFDHTTIQVGQACVSCHFPGGPASSKSPNHLNTSDVCDVCHTVNFWLPANFDHNERLGTCENCHNGVIATGKSATHIPTTLDCDQCHKSFIDWTVVTFDHSTVAELQCNSAGCHDGVSDHIGKPSNHPIIVTDNDCGACHRTTSWLPLITPFPHEQTTDTCVIPPGRAGITLFCLSPTINPVGLAPIVTTTSLLQAKVQTICPPLRHVTSAIQV